MNYQKYKYSVAQLLHTALLKLCLIILLILGTQTSVALSSNASNADHELYRAAVIDSMTIEPEEIFPLVTITPANKMVTWLDNRVLLLTFNDSPEYYIRGKKLTLKNEVWSITERELAAWYAQHKSGVSDWPLRFKQLIGLPPDSQYTHVTAMWVAPKYLCRPAYNTDITNSVMPTMLHKTTPKKYTRWFNANIIWSYFDSAYPWTRLGYTYDWSENSGEYGLTEFLIRPGAKVTIQYTNTIEEFVKRLEQDTAQY